MRIGEAEEWREGRNGCREEGGRVSGEERIVEEQVKRGFQRVEGPGFFLQPSENHFFSPQEVRLRPKTTEYTMNND